MDNRIWEGRRLSDTATLTVWHSRKHQTWGNALALNKDLLDHDILTTWDVVRLVVRVNLHQQDRVTKDGYTEVETANLDERGIVRIGSKVRAGDILVAIVREPGAFDLTAEEKLQQALFGEKATPKPRPYRWPYKNLGQVLEVSSEVFTPDIVLHIGMRHTLQEGTVLRDEEGQLFTVGTIGALGRKMDAVRSRKASIVREKSPQRMLFQKLTKMEEAIWAARSTQPYDPVTQLPFRLGRNPGQLVNKQLFALLTKEGLGENARELLTIKADSSQGRLNAHESLLKGTPFPEDYHIPWVAQRFLRLMRGLGIDAKLTEGKDLSLDVASPEKILSWSFGEVRKPETINYQTLKPDQDGLFCERIFGPIRNWECSCGKYKRLRYRGVICDRCGVEVTHSRVRRERFGHIRLAKPLIHPLAVEELVAVLGLSLEDLQRIMYYAAAIVPTPDFPPGPISWNEAREHDAALFGADAVRWLLEQKGANPDRFLLSALPVVPPEMRPMIPMNDRRFATSDLNDLYRKVINRNARLGRLIDLRAPPVIMFNETRMLQECVEALFQNSKCLKPEVRYDDYQLRGLTEQIKESIVPGLLRKTVDYAGRGVVVPDINLAQNAIGLPEEFAAELLKPFVMRKLVEESLAPNVLSARQMAEQRPLFDAVRERTASIAHEMTVLVVFQPQNETTCIAALQPAITNRGAISLHPATAANMGITFAGDAVVVHLPLSLRAQEEAKALLGRAPINSTEDAIPSVLPTLTVEELWRKAREGTSLPLGNLDRAAFGI